MTSKSFPYPPAFVLVGVDPGPTTGIIAMRWAPDVRYKPNVLHVDSDTVLLILRAMTSRLYRPEMDAPALIAIEDFVDGNRHDRSAAAKATRDVIRAIEDTVPELLTRVVAYQPAQHKTWESGARGHHPRLKAAGLWEPTEGWRHARSAASVALYAAVRSGYRPDPLGADARPGDWF